LTYLKELRRKLFADITSIPEILQGSYYRPLDGLRGLSVLFVVLYHFGVNHFLKPTHLFIYGRIGVDIFFVISGFLITTLLLKEKVKTGKISLKHFYTRRILRIVPAAYLYLVVLLGMFICYGMQISATDFLTAFLFLKNLPIKSGYYTQHLWSLAIEVQFYLIFPVLLATNVNRYFWLALLIVIIAPLVSIAGFYHLDLLYSGPAITRVTKLFMYSFWNGPVIILTGSVFSILTFKGIIKSSKNYLMGFVLMLAAIIIHTGTSLFYYPYISEYLFAIIMSYCLVLIIHGGNLLSNILQSGILVKTGVLSYSVYLWQQLFIGINNAQPWLRLCSGYPVWAVFIFKLIVLFLISAMSYYFVEKKFMTFKKKYE
jgi:peptidoglycan/LPS O-acetylase OafA/YrhL